ncbi:sensor histidine kinase inhibitor, KipI family [Nakamurella panacisegetis]|uniref:Sensor histidine kinase inhibitor, KipI family n=1 Tax=Nakamurella panacisegetis TaxID=1090615 RepID=A0A1H0KFM5_9ACTN|nr:allophanate hydrolase subunit 1 [Nakamurella panacisegetis]SDO54768.1 sensor histidine kinase inhibitor, KipI family [Nakamurella panacisegetis]
MRILACGERAVLAELGDLAEVMSLDRVLRATSPPGVIDVVPAARTVLVRFDPEVVNAQEISAWITRAKGDPGTAEVHLVAPPGATIVIPVRYDGEDLTSVAAACGLTPAEVITLHTESEFTVAFCGFAPGFAYLAGVPDILRVARRPTPRTRVPAGSVALADEFSAVYPQASPGGWQLIGHTELTVFDVDGEIPAPLTPGTRVRFVEVRR